MTGLRVSNMFLDPLGNHLLIALSTKLVGTPPELLYLHRRSNKPKKIERFRDHEITAVAFNPNNQSETTTGSILIGTSKGLIFETELGIDGEKMIQSNWKQVNMPILAQMLSERMRFSEAEKKLKKNSFDFNLDIKKTQKNPQNLKIPNYLPLYGNRDVDGLVRKKNHNKKAHELQECFVEFIFGVHYLVLAYCVG